MKVRVFTGGNGKRTKYGSFSMRRARSISSGLPSGTMSSSTGSFLPVNVSTTVDTARTRKP
eukprot:4706599-Alexandrium_andersonii.AAC.1